MTPARSPRTSASPFTSSRSPTIYQPYERALDELFGEKKFDTANENVQARIRGNILMAWSNRTGALVLTTGNKSELAVGYCTLYGDMAGGLAVLGDVYKTMVYRVARWINREREVIPRVVDHKAALRGAPPEPDRPGLAAAVRRRSTAILKLYIEEWQEVDEIAAAGFDRELVQRILKLVDTNEFKRQQAAPTHPRLAQSLRQRPGHADRATVAPGAGGEGALSE